MSTETNQTIVPGPSVGVFTIPAAALELGVTERRIRYAISAGITWSARVGHYVVLGPDAISDLRRHFSLPDAHQRTAELTCERLRLTGRLATDDTGDWGTTT